MKSKTKQTLGNWITAMGLLALASIIWNDSAIYAFQVGAGAVILIVLGILMMTNEKKIIIKTTKEKLGETFTKKEICKAIEKKIDNIATNPKELALAGHKRACCMMTLNELLKELNGE